MKKGISSLVSKLSSDFVYKGDSCDDDYSASNSGLVLSRHYDECIVLSGLYDRYGVALPDVDIVVGDVGRNQSKLLIQAHDSVDVLRWGVKRNEVDRGVRDRITCLSLSIVSGKDGFLLSNVYSKSGKSLFCGVHLASCNGKKVKLKFVADSDVIIRREELLMND